MTHLGLPRHVGLHDGEEPLDADGDAHAGHLPLLGVEHADELVVAAAAGHGPHGDGLPLGVLVVPQEDGLVDDAGVVVEAAGEAEVEGDDVGAPEELAVLQEGLHAGEALQTSLALYPEVACERFNNRVTNSCPVHVEEYRGCSLGSVDIKAKVPV